MKSDITRNTFTPEKHYTSVRQQQGRVQLDADWNEQVDITNHRLETEANDVVGRTGAPSNNAGFKLEFENELLWIRAGRDRFGNIVPGRFYIDGVMCEIEEDCPYAEQRHLKGSRLPTESGYYLAYLHVWQRHITDIDDSEIHEAALGNVDTTTRAQTVWQVKVFDAPFSSFNPSELCRAGVSEWRELTKERQVFLTAKSVDISTPVAEPGAPEPTVDGVQIENQLYRVEIHTPGPIGTATFKWSRDNGSIVGAIKSINADLGTIELTEPPPDENHGFAPGMWVEILDEQFELETRAGVLVRLTSPTYGSILTYSPESATGPIPVDRLNTPENNAKVRRWDHVKNAGIATSTSFKNLELGIRVKFTAAAGHEFKTGDYWLIPGRNVEKRIQWPMDENGNAVAKKPDGMHHHYARLGVLRNSGSTWSVAQDCRPIFSPLAAQLNFFYLSGDGQGGPPGAILQEPLRVGVTNGIHPVQGAKVQFSIKKTGEGGLSSDQPEEPTRSLRSATSAAAPNKIFVYTDANGVAEAYWILSTRQDGEPGDKPIAEQVEARLIDPDGISEVHVPILFNANLIRLAEVALYNYRDCDNSGNTVQSLLEGLVADFPKLDSDGFTTVQYILRTLLCRHSAATTPFEHQCSTGLFPGDTKSVAQALNAICNIAATHVEFEEPTCDSAVEPTVLSLFSELIENWPTWSEGDRVTVRQMLLALLCKLEAKTLPYHFTAGSKFPDNVEQTVSSALDYLSQERVPPGMIMAFANETAPHGWLECAGQSVDRTRYSALFSAIGTKFSGGNAQTTFNVPDLRGEFIRGWIHGRSGDAGLSEETGRELGSWRPDKLKSHTHTVNSHNHGYDKHSHSELTVDANAEGAAASVASYVENAGAHTTNKRPGTSDPILDGEHGIETHPRNMALMYCIKC